MFSIIKSFVSFKSRLPTAVLKLFPNITICDVAENIAMSSFAYIVVYLGIFKSHPKILN